MDDQDRTPEDLLGSLLAGKPKSQETDKQAPEGSPEPPERQEKAPEQKRISRSKKSTPKAPRPSKMPDLAGEKDKATYYLDQAILASLDEAWLQLRRLAGPEHRRQISKSWIVEQAILMAVEELKAKGSSSSIAKRIPKDK